VSQTSAFDIYIAVLLSFSDCNRNVRVWDTNTNGSLLWDEQLPMEECNNNGDAVLLPDLNEDGIEDLAILINGQLSIRSAKSGRTLWSHSNKSVSKL
jgi:hypothetical protein